MTLSLDDARQLAEKAIADLFPNKDMVVRPDRTEAYPFGWVIYYNTRAFVESGDFSLSMPGNGPILVDKEDGTVQPLSSSPGRIAEEIEEYARTRRDPGR